MVVSVFIHNHGGLMLILLSLELSQSLIKTDIVKLLLYTSMSILISRVSLSTTCRVAGVHAVTSVGSKSVEDVI
jgi:hypothetical protein